MTITKRHLKTAIATLAAAAALGACSKKPPEPAAQAPAAAASPAPGPASGNGSGASGAAGAAGAPAAAQGNPDAAKDPVFNMPAQPVLDVSQSIAELDKIRAGVLK